MARFNFTFKGKIDNTSTKIKTHSAIRMVIRMIHASLRLGELNKNDFDVLYTEFKEIFLAEDKEKAIIEYKEKLRNKHFNELGVNV